MRRQDKFIQNKQCKDIIRKIRIMNKASGRINKQTNEEMSKVLAHTNENIQVAISKSIVSDPRWFGGDKTKFED